MDNDDNQVIEIGTADKYAVHGMEMGTDIIEIGALDNTVHGMKEKSATDFHHVIQTVTLQGGQLMSQ